jgi:hypothetical protein
VLRSFVGFDLTLAAAVAPASSGISRMPINSLNPFTFLKAFIRFAAGGRGIPNVLSSVVQGIGER